MAGNVINTTGKIVPSGKNRKLPRTINSNPKKGAPNRPRAPRPKRKP